jgi:hypothetical protein
VEDDLERTEQGITYKKTKIEEITREEQVRVCVCM